MGWLTDFMVAVSKHVEEHPEDTRKAGESLNDYLNRTKQAGVMSYIQADAAKQAAANPADGLAKVTSTVAGYAGIVDDTRTNGKDRFLQTVSAVANVPQYAGDAAKKIEDEAGKILKDIEIALMVILGLAAGYILLEVYKEVRSVA